MNKQKAELHPTIENDFLTLRQRSKESELSMGDILEILGVKGPLLMIILLSLPFCQPIQIPGFSTPFGLAIAFLGLRMVFGKYSWLPKKILEKKISSGTLQKITEKALWFVKKAKRWTYPRLTWLSEYSMMQIVNGLLIFVLGICLALPLPIPFSNLTAAWSILLLSFGLIEKDGVLILIGYLASLATFFFFVITILINLKLIGFIADKVRH